MNIQTGVQLKDHTTFKIGGEASYFIEIHSIDELKKAIDYAKEKKLDFKILGGGSNVLASDHGFPGVIIKNCIKEVTFEDMGETVRVISGAGENWDELVRLTVEKGLFGLENLSLIPGTVGASPIQNIGAYGAEVKQTIEWVEVYDADTEAVKKFSNNECQFGYRDSVFKREEGVHLIVLRVAFILKKNGDTFIGYRDLADYFVRVGIARATPEEVRMAVIEIRTKKMPDLTKVGTAGSFFKNPVVTSEQFDELKKKFPEMPGHAEDGHMKVSAAWIIDKLCQMKGVCVGNACVHTEQALVIVNKGSATKKDVDSLAELITQKVKEKTGIELEREVRSF